MPRFNRARIDIYYPGREIDRETVSALVCGVYAAHHPVDGGGWNITHVPTGLAILNYLGSLQEAKAIILGLVSAQLPPLGERFGEDLTKQWNCDQIIQARDTIKAIREQFKHQTRLQESRS